MGCKEMGLDIVGWLCLDQDRVQWQASSEHGFETSGSVNDKEFLDSMTTCWPFMKGVAA